MKVSLGFKLLIINIIIIILLKTKINLSNYFLKTLFPFQILLRISKNHRSDVSMYSKYTNHPRMSDLPFVWTGFHPRRWQHWAGKVKQEVVENKDLSLIQVQGQRWQQHIKLLAEKSRMNTCRNRMVFLYLKEHGSWKELKSGQTLTNVIHDFQKGICNLTSFLKHYSS